MAIYDQQSKLVTVNINVFVFNIAISQKYPHKISNRVFWVVYNSISSFEMVDDADASQ